MSPGKGALSLQAVTKDYGPRRILDGIDLEVGAGELVVLVGASGSGKSTLLSVVAGLTEPTTGEVLLDGAAVTGPGPERGLVLQSGSLFPWRTVEKNVGFGLEMLPIGSQERARRVEWYLAEVGLTDYAQKLPRELSGGQRQRVAIARALACEPQVLLLDEPFGALDVQIKEDMQVFLRSIWQHTGTTVVLVTHDVEEAVFLAQRVVVLASDPGRIAAVVDVPFGDERDLRLKRTPEFLALRGQVEDLVRAQHERHLATT
ncbi:MAG: ssuB [Frankiales bacterium]|nr:ssuB [Frankiales bacterium]